MPRNPNCQRCPLHEHANHVCLWGVGNKRADIMLVGEAPGENEDNEGEPFIGAAGKTLDKCLKLAGLRRGKVYISNAVKCRPPGNRDPEKQELAACFSYLAEEIARVQPKVIVCVGGNALKALTGTDAITRNRGRLLEPMAKVRVGGAKIIATFHPAYYLYNHKQQTLDAIVEDLKSAVNIANPKTDTPTRKLLGPMATLNEITDALKWLAPARELACDLEWLAVHSQKSVAWPWTPGTSQLSLSLTGRVDGRLRSVALSWPEPTAKKRIAAIVEIIRRFFKRRKLIFHNAMADVIWLLHAGFEPVVGGDSMLFAYLLDEQRRAGLKGLAPLIAAVEAGWETKPWYRRPETHAGWEELLSYNAGDTESTLRLHEKMVEQLRDMPRDRARNVWRVYTRLLLPAVRPFARTALLGTPMSLQKIRKNLGEANRQYREAIAKLAEETKLRPDRAEELALSPTKQKRYIREAFGLTIDTTKEDELKPYAKQYPAIQYIQDVKHARKDKSTYLEPWERMLVRQGDNALHNVFLLGATRTGRLSAEVEEGGSILVAPRDDWSKECVEAPPGYEIHAADYSQLEIRMVAWLGPERTLRRLYNAGEDVHMTTAVGVNQDATAKTANMFFMQAGIPADRNSTEVLSLLFATALAGRTTEECLQLAANLWTNRSSRSWLWGESERQEKPSIQDWHRIIPTAPKTTLRALQEYALSRSAPPRQEQKKQRRLQHRDFVQVLSSAGTRGLSKFPEWKKARQDAKGVNFGLLYGMQVDNFKLYVERKYNVFLTIEEAAEVRQAFFDLYEDLPAWHARAVQEWQRNGYTLTPFGRYRFDITEGTQAINTPIQSTGSDLGVLAYTVIDERIQEEFEPGDARVIGFIHDNVLVCAKKSVRKRIRALIKDVMEHPPLERVGIDEIPVPLVAEVATGPSWAEVKELKEIA